MGEQQSERCLVLAAIFNGLKNLLKSGTPGCRPSRKRDHAHAVASSTLYPEVQTILEIGGQDSKIIILRNGIVSDFAMNTVCAAGTGSFLDHQSQRLGIPIEQFGEYALKSTVPVTIAGRCSVFAESDMVHKAQMGYSKEDIISGLCHALVRNYMNNVGKGKDVQGPVVFQGGVAFNKGIIKAFEDELNVKSPWFASHGRDESS